MKKLLYSEAVMMVIIVADELLPFADVFPHWVKITITSICITAIFIKKRWDVTHPKTP